MPLRQFYIHEGQDGDYTVKEGEADGGLFTFANILEAVAYIRRQRGPDDEILVSRYDASGQHIHSGPM